MEINIFASWVRLACMCACVCACVMCKHVLVCVSVCVFMSVNVSKRVCVLAWVCVWECACACAWRRGKIPFYCAWVKPGAKNNSSVNLSKRKKQKIKSWTQKKNSSLKILKCQKLTENFTTCSTNSATLMSVANPAGPFSFPNHSFGYPENQHSWFSHSGCVLCSQFVNPNWSLG